MRAARTRCDPAGTLLMTYVPSGPVRVPNVVPTTVMATFETGASAVRSVTVPAIRPPPAWAAAGAEAPANSNPSATRLTARMRFIRDLLRQVVVREPDLFLQRTK